MLTFLVGARCTRPLIRPRSQVQVKRPSIADEGLIGALLSHFSAAALHGIERHVLEKSGTPTMGGVMFILPVLLLNILLHAASLVGYDMLGRSVVLPLVVLLGFGILGAIDDWEGIRGPRRGLGMRARTKFWTLIFIFCGPRPKQGLCRLDKQIRLMPG